MALQPFRYELEPKSSKSDSEWDHELDGGSNKPEELVGGLVVDAKMAIAGGLLIAVAVVYGVSQVLANR